MQWLYITAVRLQPGGGQSSHILEFCRALAQRRRTTLLAPAGPPESIPNLHVRQVALPDRPPRELVFQWRVARAVLQQAGPAPALLYVRAAAFNLGAILAARRLGCPCLLELNGLPGLEYALEHGQSRSARLRRLLYALLARIDGRLASAVVAVTPQLADEARRWGARNILVSSNGVNPVAFQPGDQQAARRALDLPAAAEVVGFVGNFAPWQGLQTLVQGVGQLMEQRPALQLLLVGDGVERPRLEQLAARWAARIHFLGRLPHTQVPGVLAACDVLAAPLASSERNRRTGVSPLKVFEYLALQRPLLAAGLPGLEFIERDGLGLTFRPDDPAALAARLQALLDLPAAERLALGARARAAAVERYSWERLVEQVIAFGEALVPAG